MSEPLRGEGGRTVLPAPFRACYIPIRERDVALVRDDLARLGDALPPGSPAAWVLELLAAQLGCVPAGRMTGRQAEELKRMAERDGHAAELLPLGARFALRVEQGGHPAIVGDLPAYLAWRYTRKEPE